MDEVEILRRMEEGIYDARELEKLKKWAVENVTEGFDKNPESLQRSRDQKDRDWEFTLKMYLIIKDLMNGNPRLPEGAEEEMVGHNAIVGGFQGQRQWTDHWPNCDFPEAMLNTSFDHNGAREPYILATENDTLNGLGMLFMKLLTNRAQMFADVMQVPVQTLEANETGALGCAIATAAATGEYASLDEAILHMAAFSDVIQPDPGKAEIYNAKYRLYLRAIDCLDGLWDDMQKLVEWKSVSSRPES